MTSVISAVLKKNSKTASRKAMKLLSIYFPHLSTHRSTTPQSKHSQRGTQISPYRGSPNCHCHHSLPLASHSVPLTPTGVYRPASTEPGPPTSRCFPVLPLHGPSPSSQQVATPPGRGRSCALQLPHPRQLPLMPSLSPTDSCRPPSPLLMAMMHLASP